MHKRADILGKLLPPIQPVVNANVFEIWSAPYRATTEAAATAFAAEYGVEYEAIT